MIKLFWNTHNQIAPNPNELNNEVARNYKWGLYHKNNSDKWVYEILNEIKYTVVKSSENIEENDVLIIVDSTIEKKTEFYSKLKLISALLTVKKI